GFVSVTLHDKPQQLEIVVADSGRGIPLRFQEKVFEKFEQVGRTAGAGTKGTGLGLPICKALVEKHQGTISLVSEPDKGTAFTVTLPKLNGLAVFSEIVEEE